MTVETDTRRSQQGRVLTFISNEKWDHLPHHGKSWYRIEASHLVDVRILESRQY